jgi:hypothetical protein
VPVQYLRILSLVGSGVAVLAGDLYVDKFLGLDV